MINLEQIRARNALRFAQSGNPIVNSQGGDVVKKLPALIMGHGILAAGAFAFQKQQDDQKKNTENGFYLCFNAMAEHLSDTAIALLPPDSQTLEGMLQHLISDKADSCLLKRVTAESLAWLAYVRRFVKKPNKDEDEGDNGG
jgi:hypothetical protein